MAGRVTSKRAGDFTGGELALADQGQDRPASRVGKGTERGVHGCTLAIGYVSVN